MPSTRTPTQIAQRPGQAPTSVVDGTALSFPIEERGSDLSGLQALLSGLDDKYRRSTTPSFGTPDTPGSGRNIDIDGPAIRLYGAWRSSGDPFPDPLGALLNLSQVPNRADDYSESPGGWSDGAGGWTGIWHEGPFRQTSDPQHYNHPARSGPALLDVNYNWFGGSTVGADTVLTKISPANGSAILNPGGTGSNYIQAGTGDYFRLASGLPRTAVRLGLDMVRVKFADDTLETYVVTGFVSDTVVRVARITGQDYPSWGANTAVQGIWFLQPNIALGGSDLTSYSFGNPDNFFLSRPLVVAWAPQVTSNADNETTSLASLFMASALESRLAYGSKGTVLEIAHPNGTGGVGTGLKIAGTGALQCFYGRQIFNLVSNSQTTVALGIGAVTYNWSPNGISASGSVKLVFTNFEAPDFVSLTLTLGMDDPLYIGQSAGGEQGQPGDELTLVIERQGPLTDGIFQMTAWPALFRFEGNDGVLPSTGEFKVKFHFYYDGEEWLATRTDY